MNKLLLTALWLLIPLGCAAQSTAADVSKRIETRVGHGFNTARTGAAFAWPDSVVLNDGLTEQEAVATALWNNATFQADLAALGLARANLVEAGLLQNPIFSLLFPIGPKQMEFTLLAPLESLWQRPKRVAVAERDLARVSESLVQNGLDLVRDVRLAFADATIAEQRVRLAAEQVKERAQFVQITNVRLRAGDIGELETGAARIEERLAEEQAARLTQAAALARVRLRALLGMEADANFALAPATSEPVITVTLADLTKTALAARPELRAAELAIETAGARAKWERSRIFALTATLDANGEGLKGFEMGPGLQVEIPLFHRNKGGITRAEAEIERAARQYAAVRQRIVMEVQESYVQFTQAQDALKLWRARVLPPIDEDIRRAQHAYDKGDVAYLYVLETSRRLTEARLREVDVAASLQRAAAQLDRSVGRNSHAK